MGYSGAWFTWEKGNLPGNNVHERLDRGVASAEWMSMFPNALVKHLPHSISIHCPLLIDTETYSHLPSQKSFRFEACWLLECTFENIVKDFWLKGDEPLLEKLRVLKKNLFHWDNLVWRKIVDLKKRLMKKLDDLSLDEVNDDTLENIIYTKIHLNLEVDKDERY